MFSKASGFLIQGGTFVNQANRTSRGMDILMESIAAGAFYNSDELYDAPKYHPHTRVAVLNDIMQWVNESESARENFILWLFGPAGAGKSAIGKKIAEIAAEQGLLVATFFFSRTSPTRSTKDRLIATLAYQLALSIPSTRTHIEDTIERDPAIFKKDIQTQIDTLLIKPIQSMLSTQIISSKKLVIIDGLDECNDSKVQVAILDAISRSFHKVSIIVLVISRPELDLVTSFNVNEPLKSIHRRLALDHTYRPDDDIRLFFSDKFEHIRLTHRLRSTIPISWPTQDVLDTLVEKSSGQFIYAATVVKFVESNRHRPSARLDIILGISPPGSMNPFAELDALYSHILSCVDDIQLTLRVLSFYVVIPEFSLHFRTFVSDMSTEVFLSLEPGDIDLSLIDLSSIILYDESFGAVKILHASLVDFLTDKRRSTIFYIDMASTCTYFVRRVLQCIKGPDGIRAGDCNLFQGVIWLCRWIIKGQLRRDILDFDLDAYITAVIRRHYTKEPIFGCSFAQYPVIWSFSLWMNTLAAAGLEDRDKQEILDRYNQSFESRVQKYQSDWRLQLLCTLGLANHYSYQSRESISSYGVPGCKRIDILLGMDDHNLHLVDQNALDLRHRSLDDWSFYSPGLFRMIAPYQDGDRFASVVLHCMHFLSNPPKYSKNNDCERSEIGLIYAEWKATCDMALDILGELLQLANISPELVQFLSNHDIDPEVQKDFYVIRVWLVGVRILAFLCRANVCVNWRIISVIQRAASFATDHSMSIFEESDARLDKKRVGKIILDRLDQCCAYAHR